MLYEVITHSKKNSYITAASTPQGEEFGFVFINCKLTANDSATQVYLGRPWRIYAKTVFIDCEMGKHIRPEGWHNWSKPEAEKMGASKEETMMVAGFAGGIGLSGNACGALGAAILLKSLDWQKKNPGDTTFKIPEGQKVLKAFLKETNSEVLCYKLCGKRFSSLEEHSEFISCANAPRTAAVNPS